MDDENKSEINDVEKARAAILAALLRAAAFDGWSETALEAARVEAGVEKPVARLAFPSGLADALTYWSERLDDALAPLFRDEAFQAMKIREKIPAAVMARLAEMAPHKEAARRAAALFALPLYAPLASRLVWETADRIWRGAGDRSTDFNYYSKRTILSGVWSSTFIRWLGDDSEDGAATRAFLDARIDNVMTFEKAKSRAQEFADRIRSPIGFFAGLRYPGRGATS